VLLLINTEPMRFAAVCDTCGAREEIEGTRAEVVLRLGQLAWRLDERFTKAVICAKCAGPPSVFRTARVEPDSARCSACNGSIDRCIVCHAHFEADAVISCRGTHGHAHAQCATQKIRKFEPKD
jgi:hypothetical protein